MESKCMITEVPYDSEDSSNIVVVQRGKVIGVVGATSLQDIKTVRLTFTRDSADSAFRALQGQCVEVL